MSKSPIYHCYPKDGHLNMPNFLKRQFVEHLRRLDGKHCVMRLQKFREAKEDELRGYYFKCIMRPLSEYTGDTEERLHEVMKLKFNPIDVMGEKVGGPVFSRNSGMERDDKERFIRQVRDFILHECNMTTEPWGGIE